MPDISVNIRGRDDGFGSMLDSLRDKANNLGRDVGNLDNFDHLTRTERRMEIENVNENVTQTRRQSVIDEFNSLREANMREFSQITQDYANGRISEREYNQHTDRFEQYSNELNIDEQNELLAIENESKEFLKQILRQLTLQERLDRERKQRDGSEHSEGSIGHLLNQNGDLRRRQRESTDQSEIDELQAQIEANNETIRGMRNNGREVDGNGGLGGDYSRFTSGLQSGAASAARGDLSGTVMGGLQMAGGMGMAGGIAMGVGASLLALKEFFSNGEKVQEALGLPSAMRGGYSTDSNSLNKDYQDKIVELQEQITGMGMSQDEFASIVSQKALNSKMSSNNLTLRALDDTAFQKGFGADVGIFSQFERFTKNQETATTIGLDVLNVLTSINKSSLKENDLSTLAEKLQSQNTILSLQRSKRDIVDNDSALRILAAFEKVGLSDKGERGSDFINQTIQGLGDGGSDNEMLFKYEAAKRARPDLAGDPAALRRLVRFNSDDPKYQAEFFKFARIASGGSKMALEDIMYGTFDPSSEKDLDMYINLANNKDGALDTLISGKDVNKSRKSTLNEDAMYTNSGNATGAYNELSKSFTNTMQEFLIDFKKIFTEEGVKIKSMPKSNVENVNKLKTGR